MLLPDYSFLCKKMQKVIKKWLELV